MPYVLTPNEREWGRSLEYSIEGEHRCWLPGVNCARCGNTWTAVGSEYPLLDVADRLPSRMKASVTGDDFARLRDKLAAHLPQNVTIHPGSEFGAFRGVGRGSPGDFAWRFAWTLFIRREVFDELAAMDVRGLRASEPKIQWRHGGADLVELAIDEGASYHESSWSRRAPAPCETCGFVPPGREPKRAARLPASPTGELEIFRVRGFPTTIIVSDRLAAAIRDRKWSDCILREVKVAS